MVRLLTLFVMSCLLAAPAMAIDLGGRAPVKAASHHAAPPPDPEILRQGGDTIADAVELVFPVYDVTGTTVGYTDDYDEVCPYSNSTSPDVVYTFLPSILMLVDIDLLGSTYDTKIYLYDENLALVACNDDYYPDYVSKLEFVELEGGVRYYLVIDGYGGDAGDYVLNVYEWIIEYLPCPAGAALEEEPPLAIDYVDEYNGGCNSPDAPGGPPFQHLASEWFCGQSGWFLFEGANYRDTDWFTVTLPPSGSLTITGEAEEPSYLFELGPQDCDQVGVLQDVEFGFFQPGSLILTGEPGSEVWVWVGPTVFTPPYGDVYEYLYVLMLDHPVAIENRSWTGVKALFD